MTDQLTLTQPLTGAAVTAQGTPDMTVAVSAGSVLVANASVSVAADTVTITAADTAQDRIDAIVADSTGAVSVIDGDVNDGSNAQPPDTTGYALLGYVYVLSQAAADYTGTIVADVIEDKRDFALVHTSPYRVSGLWYGAPGNQSTRGGWATDELYLLPFFTGEDLDIQAIGIRHDIGGNAGCVGRFGIYSDDGAGVLTLLVDAGTVTFSGASAPADRTISTSQTLTPGWWWFALVFQSLTVAPTVATISPVASPVGQAALVATIAPGVMTVAGTSGALPASPSSFTFGATSAPNVMVQAA